MRSLGGFSARHGKNSHALCLQNAISPVDRHPPHVRHGVSRIDRAACSILRGAALGEPFAPSDVRVRQPGGAGSHGRPPARDRAALSAGRRQAPLLPVDRIPPRANARQQLEQSGHLRSVPGHASRDGRLPGRCRGGRARRCARQRRSGTPCGLLSGLPRHARHARLRVRNQLRVRPLPAGDRQRLPEGEAGQLAGVWHPMGNRTARGSLSRSRLWPDRTRRRSIGALQPDVAGVAAAHRRSARRAHCRLRRADGESPPTLLRAVLTRLRHADLQHRRLSEGGGAEDRVGDDLEGPVPVRRRAAGAGAATSPGVFPGCLRDARPRRPVPAGSRDLRRLSSEGRRSPERHASCTGHRRVDAHPRRRARSALGHRVADHAVDDGVHESHAVAGGAREVARGLARARRAAAPADHPTRSIGAFSHRSPPSGLATTGVCNGCLSSRKGNQNRCAWPT